MLSDLQELAVKLKQEGIFLGGKTSRFGRGRNQLITLIDQGLTPDCKLLDVGCGALRGGYWTMSFLQRGHYFGIEPNRTMLNIGLNRVVGPEIIAEKLPRFNHNSDFDFTVFGEKFDYIIGRSIWSHTSQNQIRACLDSFMKVANRNGAMLMSYFKPGKVPLYIGEGWVGKSDQSTQGGLVAHSPAWIAAECAERGLIAKELYKATGQTWVKVFRMGEHQQVLDSEPSSIQILGSSRSGKENGTKKPRRKKTTQKSS